MSKQKRRLRIINPEAGGIDVGSEKIFISVEAEDVKSFNTFTNSFAEAVKYLQENGVKTVAMESTGVYWITLYDMIKEAGIEVYVVNGREVKNVPGRKSDVADCQWIQQLHSYGLLRASFIPEANIRQLRSYMRLRTDHINKLSSQILLMQKALDLMNIKLHNVISDITGVSGLKILRAIIQGEKDPIKLTEMCDRQILNNKKDLVTESLRGYYKEEDIFTLRQALEIYDFYEKKIEECDKAIEKHLNEITSEKPTPKKISKQKKVNHNSHPPKVEDLHLSLIKLTDGKDPSQVTGLSDYTMLQVISEVGTDLSKWKTEKHFTSWLGLSPGKHSSGKSNKQKRLHKNTRAGQIFKRSAFAVANSKNNALIGFYRRIKSKHGAGVAIKATARKIAVMFYNIMTKGFDFVEQGLKKYQETYEIHLRKRLEKQAKKLGLTLVPGMVH
jgi:transposase